MLSSRPAVLMKGNGFIAIGMAGGDRLLTMVALIRGSFGIIRYKARGASSIVMVTFFRDSGRMTGLMGSASTLTETGPFIRATGKITSKTGKA